MKRIKFLLANAGLLVAMAVPLVNVGSAHAAPEVVRCNSDLAVTKQVKVPGGAFVDSTDSASAPSAHVSDEVDWLISVENHSSGCEGTPELPGDAIILHDALPAGVTYVSSVADAGSYDASTNDWTFNNLSFYLHPTIHLQITTTANQVGSFENVATLNQLKFCTQANDDCKALTINYVIGDDQYSSTKDVDPSNDSANAWVNIQSDPAVLAASTVASTPDTGFGAPAKSSSAPILIELGLLGLGVAGLLARKRSSSSK